MVEATPAQVEMDTGTNTKSVKVEMEAPSMPLSSKLAHILAILVSGVIALAVSLTTFRDLPSGTPACPACAPSAHPSCSLTTIRLMAP